MAKNLTIGRTERRGFYCDFLWNEFVSAAGSRVKSIGYSAPFGKFMPMLLYFA